MTASRRQHGRPAGRIRAGLLAWPGGGIRLCRRRDKALPAGQRQHGRPAGGIRAGLLAWPGGGIRFCRRGGANMDGRRAGFGPAPIQSKTACRRNSSSCKPTSLAFLVYLFPFSRNVTRIIPRNRKNSVSPSLCRAPTVSLFVFLQSVFLQDYTVHLTMYSPSW